jgi:LmbE family N-acetylglucosaminyl deacetylase
MKKVIFGIFAHPDDEAFGPAATLIMEKASGSDIHLICATAGEAGVNPDNHDALEIVRLEEWRTAGELIGADSMHFLGLKDGHLCNDDYFEITKKIMTIVKRIVGTRDDIEIEFMTFDLNGLTGHIDHIVISRVTHYVFATLKAKDSRVTRLRLTCLPKEAFETENYDWLYMEAGRTTEEIDEVIDGREYLPQVLEVMRAHRSQRADGEGHIETRGDQVAVNHFLIKT